MPLRKVSSKLEQRDRALFALQKKLAGVHLYWQKNRSENWQKKFNYKVGDAAIRKEKLSDQDASRETTKTASVGGVIGTGGIGREQL